MVDAFAFAANLRSVESVADRHAAAAAAAGGGGGGAALAPEDDRTVADLLVDQARFCFILFLYIVKITLFLYVQKNRFLYWFGMGGRPDGGGGGPARGPGEKRAFSLFALFLIIYNLYLALI